MKPICIITHPLFALLWLTAGILSYHTIDKPLALYLHQFQFTLLHTVAKTIAFLGQGTLYCIIAMITWLLSTFYIKNERIRRIATLFFFALLIPGIASSVLKWLACRARPFDWFDHGLYGFYLFHFKWHLYSFPSGHATTIGSMMMACTILWRRHWPVFLLLALIVATGRLIICAHYLSDIMAGLYLGAFLVAHIARIQGANEHAVTETLPIKQIAASAK